MFMRPIGRVVEARLREPRRFIQVLAGPRQAGKTTLARQVVAGLSVPAHYASADDPALRDAIWIEQQWAMARLTAGESGGADDLHQGSRPGRHGDPADHHGGAGAILILDEIQKISGWSDVVKRLWDEDSLAGTPLQVIVLGSAPLLVQRGLTESLAGRFELVPITHWSLPEMRDAFGWGVSHFVFYGAYPGAAALIDDPPRWASYIREALVETTLGRDILLLTRVDKPALLRRLFHLACDYSGRELSYQKMIGQLQDAGNTTTLAHYLDLLSGAGMVTGLQKYAGETVRQRASSPKLQVMNTALMTALANRTFEDAQHDREYWGRLVESAAGAHLVNAARLEALAVYYWRAGDREVDFVIQRGRELLAIEVKSGRRKPSLEGMKAFQASFGAVRTLLVGEQGVSLEMFLSTPVGRWFDMAS